MALLVLGLTAILAAAYVIYGRILGRYMRLDDNNPTPACRINDGMDYVPAKGGFLLGQHFSAIAAAAPIVGPIMAGMLFGWVPAVLWLVLGAILIGGVHDFMALAASIRHGASSIGQLVRQYISPFSQKSYLIFVWITLMYVIIAFADLTAHTFTQVSGETALGPGVVVSSFLYLAIGVVMGVTLRKSNLPLWAATAIFLPMVFVSIWLGTRLPASLIQALQGMPVKGWEVILLAYCFAASLIPVWLLLQPRGYLGGWFLYLVIGIGLIGVLFGGFTINYPAFDLKGGLSSFSTGKPLFPILFVTIACGACSGFHGIVASGTTSKQLRRESDVRLVGYGAMLLESLTAILALSTLMILAKGSELAKGDPDLVYANGIAGYLGLLGVDRHLALSFALLAFSTFIYDTLDVSTRLARYVVQELFSWKSFAGSVAATVASLAFPLIFLMLAKEKGYKIAWPIFGTSNQLLAALTLLVVSVWLKKTGRNPVLTLVPMVFIMAVTLASLGLQIRPLIVWLTRHGELKATDLVSGIVGTILLALTVCLMFDAIASLRRVPKLAEAAATSS